MKKQAEETQKKVYEDLEAAEKAEKEAESKSPVDDKAEKKEAPAKEEAPAKKEAAPAKAEAPAKKDEAPAKKEGKKEAKKEAPAKKEEKKEAKKEEKKESKKEAPAKKEEKKETKKEEKKEAKKEEKKAGKKEGKKAGKKEEKKDEAKKSEPEPEDPISAKTATTGPISESRMIPSDDEFNKTYSFSILVLDSAKNDVSKSKDSFDATNMHEAYSKFLGILNDKNYDFMKSVDEVQKKEYLLIGNLKPIISSNLIKCVMQPPVTGRDMCTEKLLAEISTDYKMMKDEYNFPAQTMIGWGLNEGLIDFAKKYGDTEQFSSEFNNNKGGAQSGRFYVVEDLETK